MIDDELECEWAGSLPPIGAACEGYIYADTADQGRPLNRWVEGRFIGSACSSNGGVGGIFKSAAGTTHFIGAYSYFRPIRTPEQIAAEQREIGIDAIFNAYTYTVGPCTHKLARSQAERLYDAGIRKMMSDAEEVKA